MFKYCCLFLLTFSYLAADPTLSEGTKQVPDEVEVIDDLIASTEAQLTIQKDLREGVVEFQKQRHSFELGSQTKKQAFIMVKTASRLLDGIKEHHLEQAFSPQFLEELVFFSSIADKSAPIRP
jgi:hypothetical protein